MENGINSAEPTPLRATPAKICPILSLASLWKEPSRIATPDGSVEVPQAFLCQGPACQWWMSQRNEKGETVGGGCATEFIAIGMAQQAGVTQNLANALHERLVGQHGKRS